MPWTVPLRRLAGQALAVAMVWLSAWLCAAGVARAQGIESVLSPGKVIQGHVKLESECAACHIKFDRNAQDRLCMDCHKDVAQDVRTKGGYHGRVKPQACRTCHTDHKGRDAKIAEFDKRQFDHTLTDYLLRGKHQKVECDKCHEPSKKWRQAPLECLACHKKDDIHKGSLGAKCADCHTESRWTEAKFDHDKTRFALTGKHIDTQCSACHKKGVDYKEAPRTCIGCHKKDDDGAKGHKGQYGEKCESCHTTKAWKPTTFNHDTETKYALRGKHRSTKCGDCHTGHLYKVEVPTDCFSCHKKDDKHKETLGRDCGACHTERDWKERAKFDHDKTRFPLLGKHAEVKCDACHKSTLFKEAPKECVGCHKKDDKHEGTLGETCGSCHGERDWKTTRGRFDHDKTEFRLRNAHAAPKVECKSCHVNLKSFRKTPMSCYSCHKKDDKHEGQQGRDCGACHDDRNWKVASFNHARTQFPLVGRHVAVICKDCHVTPRYKDAPRDCWSCHKKDDKHKLVFGTKCESCHNARAWALWDFDHTRRAKFVLDGGHTKLSCERCHTKPPPAGRASAEVGDTCVACHRRDDAHDGAFGPACEQCHFTDRWKRIRTRVGQSRLPSGDLPAELAQAAPPAWTLGLASHSSQAGNRRTSP